MNFEKITTDRFFTGVILGLLLIPITYRSMEFVVGKLADLTAREDLLHAPRIQLFTLAVSILICRFLIVNFNREKIGKGFFLTLFFAAISYVYYSFRILHAF